MTLYLTTPLKDYTYNIRHRIWHRRKKLNQRCKVSGVTGSGYIDVMRISNNCKYVNNFVTP